MYYIVESAKSIDQASTDLEAAVKRHGFGAAGAIHAWGLCPRRIPRRLARTTPRILPSALFHSVGIPKSPLLAQQGMDFAAQYPACTCPCQRFALAFASDDA